MDAEVKKIYAENPEAEQWELLLHYSYPQNIEKYFKKNGIEKPETALVESISGSILQAKEYFDVYERATLQISPLLLYYGVSNLYYGISNLLTGKVNKVDNHGMKIVRKEYSRIGDIEIIPYNPKAGALSLFNSIYSGNEDLPSFGLWTVAELFSSIPDLFDDFNSFYNDQPHVIPLEIIKEPKAYFERINPSDVAKYNDLNDLIKCVEKYDTTYLNPQYGPQMKYIILRPKLYTRDIGVYSMSGRKYLQVAFNKKGRLINPSLEIKIFMALFALSYICRYTPELWNPFVRNDATGEKLFVEKVLYISKRFVPNLIINRLFNKRVYFVTGQQGLIDRSDIITKQDITSIVQDEMMKIREMERIKKNER